MLKLISQAIVILTMGGIAMPASVFAQNYSNPLSTLGARAIQSAKVLNQHGMMISANALMDSRSIVNPDQLVDSLKQNQAGGMYTLFPEMAELNFRLGMKLELKEASEDHQSMVVELMKFDGHQLNSFSPKVRSLISMDLNNTDANSVRQKLEFTSATLLSRAQAQMQDSASVKKSQASWFAKLSNSFIPSANANTISDKILSYTVASIALFGGLYGLVYAVNLKAQGASWKKIAIVLGGITVAEMVIALVMNTLAYGTGE